MVPASVQSSMMVPAQAKSVQITVDFKNTVGVHGTTNHREPGQSANGKHSLSFAPVVSCYNTPIGQSSEHSSVVRPDKAYNVSQESE